MVSMHGAVVHDSEGYGMSGYGHNRMELRKVMSEEAVMANHMTPSPSHADFIQALRSEIGGSREQCPFDLSFASILGLRATDAGRVCGDRKVHNLVVRGSFHGRSLCADWLRASRATPTRRGSSHHQQVAGWRGHELRLEL